MTRAVMLSRRTLLIDGGRAAFGLVVLGAAACASDEEAGSGSSAPPSDAPATGADDATPTPSEPDATASSPAEASSGAAAAGGELDWSRVDLGFVSAYVLVRGGEAAVVDTGVEGSATAIESTLGDADLAWSDVGHVILTHRHPDHVGSAEAVLTAAADATAYAGAGELDEVTTPRPPQTVADGDDVFGLRVVATPGHTSGHVSVLDPGTRLLVAGDALNGQDGGVVGPSPQFSSDMPTALDSVRKLADLDVDTVLFGHGDPVVGDAGARIAELAASL